MPHPIAYLAFDGNCAEAVRFYEQALSGKLETLTSGGDSPMADQIPKEHAHRIIHARLALPGRRLCCSRRRRARPSMPYQGIHGVGLALNYDTVDEARAIFDKLVTGGQTTMPMQPSYWAKAWGMGIDRYGVAWIVNGELIAY